MQTVRKELCPSSKHAEARRKQKVMCQILNDDQTSAKYFSTNKRSKPQIKRVKYDPFYQNFFLKIKEKKTVRLPVGDLKESIMEKKCTKQRTV